MNEPRKLTRVGGQVVAVQNGLDGAPINVLIQEVTKEGDSFAARHADIVGNNMTRGQAALKTREAAAAMLVKVDATVRKIKAEKLRVVDQMTRAAPPHQSCGA